MWEALCGDSSPFWDYNLSWNTTNPELTECFQSTVLVWVPCLILWIFLPLEIYCLRHSRSGHIRWNLLNISKQIICTILLLLSITKLGVTIYYYFQGEALPVVEFLSPVLMTATFLLANILIYCEMKQGIQSSALLIFFWLFLTASGALMFHSVLLDAWRKMLPQSRIKYSIFMIHFPLVVSQLILSVFKDAEPLYRNPEDTEENACPLNTSSFPSKFTFSWFNRLIWLGYRRTLELQNVWKASPEVMTKNTVAQFLRHWKTTDKKKSLQKVIWKAHWPTILKGWSIRLLGDMLIYASPMLLKQFLTFVGDEEPSWHGYVYIFGMFLTAFSESMCAWHGSFFGITARVSISSSFISMIYRKSLTLCSASKQTMTTGEIINHMAVDIDNVSDFMYNLVYDMTFPFQICLGLYLLYNLLGVAAFGGMAAMVAMIVLSGFIAHQMQIVEIKFLKHKDQRIKQINEAILGIKVLKLFAWETPFIERIKGIRVKEVDAKKRGLILQGVTTLMWRVSTLTVSLVCFTTYIMLDPKNVIDAPTAFVTIILVDILSIPMMRLPVLIAHFIQAYVSMGRLNKFMACKDLDPYLITHDEDNEYAIDVRNASFAWDLNEMPLLNDVDFKVSKGSLVAVVGPVGCGKSSLISALLGEMDKLKGIINTKGNIAYVPQQAWIQNATVKENILLGKQFQEKFYKSVIKACALEPDLAILAGGDETEIGEKGINLSGGQKQRVSLARAVFNDADIYLLDDPLSAVDSHVGEHIFEQVIGPAGLLKNKTRVLVTHGIAHLPKVNQIVVICKGCITEVGTYTQLVERKGAFSEFLATYGQANSEDKKSYMRTESVRSKTMSINDDVDDDERARGIKLTTTEHIEEGEVSSSVYLLYLKYIGVWASIGIFTIMAASMALSTSANVWLSIWSSDPVSPDPETKSALQNMRLGVYAALELSFASVMFVGILTLVYTSMKAAIDLHSKTLLSIFRSPMSFFDTTPSGRIVNRFSKDVDMVDSVLPNSFQDFLIGALEILSAAIVICIKLPWLILVFLPVAFIYYLMQKFFIKAADQLRRLESVTRSPIYSRFTETIAGASTVRAFQLQRTFIEQFDEMLDTSLKNKYYFSVLFRWIGVRLDLLGNVLVIFTALFAMFQRGSMDASTIALIVTYAHSINFTFCWLVYNAGMLESNIISVERLHEYICLKPEASWDQPDRKPPSLWPVRGNVQFRNFSTKYRDGLPAVLHGLTCDINDGEKIGVVGRTGAGKSSITLSLFRIIEATEGTILIDGVDISKIGLHDLRNHLTIIPQDPVLYSGSLRMNLDPFDQHSDVELWKALELAHLKEHIASLAAELQHEIAEGGENLSVGQRQLVCLARALLRKTKILVLDEATAAVDLETDELIQETIRKEFSDCTVITIAHRINTILDCSRVIVMDNGRIQEFDHPATLLNDKNSLFYSMAKFAGLAK